MNQLRKPLNVTDIIDNVPMKFTYQNFVTMPGRMVQTWLTCLAVSRVKTDKWTSDFP